MDLCRQSDGSVFKMLSRFVIAFLPWGKSFFNVLAAVPIHSDFGVQENKVCYWFYFSPFCLSWSDGTRFHDLSFLNIEFYKNHLTWVRIQASFIMKGEGEWLVFAYFLVLESFVLAAGHKGQDVPVNLQWDKCYSLFCNFFSLYKWTH